MSDRALIVLPNGITIEEPFRLQGSQMQYVNGASTYAIERIRAGSDPRQGTTWEIYKEAFISEDDALARVREWNRENPAFAVPPAAR